MHGFTSLSLTALPGSTLKGVMLSSGLFAATLLSGTPAGLAQTNTPSTTATHQASAATHRATAHHPAKNKPAPEPIAQTPPPPPPPHWPINDTPTPPSVAWDSSGLRISASNSSLQQILSEVSTDTGSKVVGAVPDQRVYGNYGPGDARDVLSQLLQGSGYNFLLAGDIGKGAPSEIVLTPRRSGPGNAPNGNAMNRPQQGGDSDDESSDQTDEEPQPQVQQPPMPNETRPGFGPNGPMRTPQQVMEEMQQRQQMQQQQMQQQQMQQQQQQQQQPQNPQQ